MSKIKVNSSVCNMDKKINDSTVYGLKNENKILYTETDGTKMKIEINDNNVNIVRKNEEINLDICFDSKNKTKGLLKINALNCFIDVLVVTKKLIIEKRRISVVYDLYISSQYSNTFFYDLKWSD